MQDMPQMPSHRHFLRGLRQSSSARHFRKHTRPCVRRDSIAIRTILRRRVVACDEITARMNSVRGKKTTTNLSLGEIFVARARIPRSDEAVVFISVRLVAVKRVVRLRTPHKRPRPLVSSFCRSSALVIYCYWYNT